MEELFVFLWGTGVGVGRSELEGWTAGAFVKWTDGDFYLICGDFRLFPIEFNIVFYYSV